MLIPYLISLELVVILPRLFIVQQVHIQPVVTIASSTTSRPTAAPKPIDATPPATWHLHIGCVVISLCVALVAVVDVSSTGLVLQHIDLGLIVASFKPVLLMHVTMSSASTSHADCSSLYIRL